MCHVMYQEGKSRSCAFEPKTFRFLTLWCTSENLIFRFMIHSTYFKQGEYVLDIVTHLPSKYCNLRQIPHFWLSLPILSPEMDTKIRKTDRFSKTEINQRHVLLSVTHTQTMRTLSHAYQWYQTKETCQEAPQRSLQSCEQPGHFPWQ